MTVCLKWTRSCCFFNHSHGGCCFVENLTCIIYGFDWHVVLRKTHHPVSMGNPWGSTWLKLPKWKIPGFPSVLADTRVNDWLWSDKNKSSLCLVFLPSRSVTAGAGGLLFSAWSVCLYARCAAFSWEYLSNTLIACFFFFWVRESDYFWPCECDKYW